MARDCFVSDNSAYFWMSKGNDTVDKLWVGVYDGTIDEVGINYTLNEWTHMAMVLVDGVLYGYKDGVLFDSVATNGLQLGNSIVQIGSWTGNQQYFNGKIDEVRIYNRALSAEEIQRLYNLGR